MGALLDWIGCIQVFGYDVDNLGAMIAWRLVFSMDGPGVVSFGRTCTRTVCSIGLESNSLTADCSMVIPFRLIVSEHFVLNIVRVMYIYIYIC